MDLWPESVVSAGNLKSGSIPQLITPIVKFIYNHCDKILVSSRGFIESITDKGIDRGKIEYYPQWAESIFQPILSDTRKIEGVPEDGFKIMFAGNIGEAQDFPSVLQAAKILKEDKSIHWIILGNGRKKIWVEEEIKELGLEECFHMLGSYPLEQMPEFYSASDAMLFSLKRKDIFSLTIPAKVQTYLACGKPVLAMVDGEGASVIDDAQAGYTCPAESPALLAENILRMRRLSKREITGMGNHARFYYQNNFDRAYLLDKIEGIFKSLI